MCDSNKELASLADIIFLCVRPVDMKTVVTEIKDSLNEKTLLISLNSSICFVQLESVCKNKFPEEEMGMGSELVSCMPGVIAAIFHEICVSAKQHTDIPEDEIVRMVLNTMVGTGKLMLEKDYSFEQVVSRVATKGGITEEGTKVIREQLPEVIDELFNRTLEKRRQTTINAQKSFAE